jgi:hypothetical protein
VRLFLRDNLRYLPSFHSRQEITGRVGELSRPIRHYMATDIVKWWLRSLRLARIEGELMYMAGERFSGLKVVAAFWKFLRRFIFKLGFLYGWGGLFVCLQRFLYAAAQQACLLELERGFRSPNPEPHEMTFK